MARRQPRRCRNVMRANSIVPIAGDESRSIAFALRSLTRLHPQRLNTETA